MGLNPCKHSIEWESRMRALTAVTSNGQKTVEDESFQVTVYKLQYTSQSVQASVYSVQGLICN